MLKTKIPKRAVAAWAAILPALFAACKALFLLQGKRFVALLVAFVQLFGAALFDLPV